MFIYILYNFLNITVLQFIFTVIFNTKLIYPCIQKLHIYGGYEKLILQISICFLNLKITIKDIFLNELQYNNNILYNIQFYQKGILYIIYKIK